MRAALATLRIATLLMATIVAADAAAVGFTASAVRFGTSSEDRVVAAAIDGSGNLVVVGNSAGAFTATGVVVHGRLGARNVFVATLDPTGTTIRRLVVIGGSTDDEATDVALDSSGNVYVCGVTSSPDFPTTAGTLFPVARSGGGFLLKLPPTGSTLTYSTLLSQSALRPAALAVDTSGAAVITGTTTSSFRVTPRAVQQAALHTEPAFVMKVDAAARSLVFATFLGNSSATIPYDLTLDNSGVVYLTGAVKITGREAVPFPTTPNALRGPTYIGTDMFVVKLSADGSAITFSTCIGGRGEEGEIAGITTSGRRGVIAIPATPGSRIWVAGVTNSTDLSTTVGAFQRAYGGGLTDGFLIGLSDSPLFTGAAVSTYLGGMAADRITAFGEATSSTVTVAGDSDSPNFPLAPDAALSPTMPPAAVLRRTATITKFKDALPVYSTAVDVGIGTEAVAAGQGSGGARLVGNTLGNPPTLTFGSGGLDAFVARIAEPPPPPPPMISGLARNRPEPELGILGSNFQRNAAVLFDGRRPLVTQFVDSGLLVIIPEAFSLGNHLIEVINPDGQRASIGYASAGNGGRSPGRVKRRPVR